MFPACVAVVVNLVSAGSQSVAVVVNLVSAGSQSVAVALKRLLQTAHLGPSL